MLDQLPKSEDEFLQYIEKYTACTDQVRTNNKYCQASSVWWPCVILIHLQVSLQRLLCLFITRLHSPACWHLLSPSCRTSSSVYTMLRRGALLVSDKQALSKHVHYY